MEFNELMQSFAAKYGLADLKVDNGTAVLEIDGMTVGFIHDPVPDSVMVVAEIGCPETDVSANFASAMLKANYLFAGTAGAVLCQNPETGAYAFVTVALNRDFSCWSTKLDDSKVGTATIAQRTTLDLTQKPLPVVTDVTFSQTFSPDEIRLTSDQ